MKLIAPDYFNDFKCIASACRHSCCVGWEIDVDPVSYLRYMSMPGEFGDRVRRHLDMGESGPYFRMTDEARCPFLNGDGLCDMIIEQGEECLCQICDDHPRFRNFFSDREEIGLGLCCEAAGRLILGREEPVGLFTIEADGKRLKLDNDEKELLDARSKLIAVAQNRTIPVFERVRAIMEALEIASEIDYAGWAGVLRGLERLDDEWDNYIDMLEGGEMLNDMDKWELPMEQLLVYLLYRHIPAALDDGDFEGHAAFCCIMWLIVRRMCAAKAALGFEDIVETARMYSSEIEYSDENIGAIIEALYENE